jgi:folate-binding protein YgfZ
MSRTWIHLEEAVVLRVGGKDARRYLNNRLSNDLRNTKPGEVVRAAALTPQGRVEGLFSVLVESEESFLLLCDGGRRNTILAALSRYIVADRVSIEDISLQTTVLHGVDLDRAELVEGVVSAIPLARISVNGCDYTVEGVERQRVLARCTEAWGTPLTPEEYALLRWKIAFATYPQEVNENNILTEAGMKEAVSFTKGCYVGQEVIERSDAIGKLPRTLERIQFEGVHHNLAGAPVMSASGQSIGKVVSCAIDTEHTCTGVFAFLKSGAYAKGDSVRCVEIKGSILSGDEVL